MEGDETEVRRKIIKNVASQYDFSLVLLIILMCVFGLIMIFSTSYYNANYFYQNGGMFFKQQLVYAIVGLFLMLLISTIDYHCYGVKIKNKPVLMIAGYIFITLLQYAVMILGNATNGSSRWFEIGSAKIQPSEFAKVMVIVIGSYALSTCKKMTENIPGYVLMIAALGFMVAPIAKQNLSTAIIVVGVFMAMVFVVTDKKRYTVIACIVGALIAYILIFKVGYRANRVEGWQNIEDQKGSQILQGLYAIASGGLFGKGLGNGTLKKGYIQEVHTDMIFSVICEELGIIGGIMVIALFLLLLWKIYRIAMNAQDLQGSLIASGVFVHIAVQTWIHIAVVTNTMPATGATLPFISYGGSSLIVMMVEMGLVLSVSKYTYYEYEDENDSEGFPLNTEVSPDDEDEVSDEYEIQTDKRRTSTKNTGKSEPVNVYRRNGKAPGNGGSHTGRGQRNIGNGSYSARGQRNIGNDLYSDREQRNIGNGSYLARGQRNIGNDSYSDKGQRNIGNGSYSAKGQRNIGNGSYQRREQRNVTGSESYGHGNRVRNIRNHGREETEN